MLIAIGKLGHAGHTQVDDQDATWLQSLNRTVSIFNHGYVFIAGCKREKHKLLHRWILERKLGRPLSKEELCDHVNGDRLDNRRENLRLASKLQNCQNRRKNVDNQSGYKGVGFEKSTGKWRARIRVNRIAKRLGSFDTPEQAYEAYCAAAREYHGEFASV